MYGPDVLTSCGYYGRLLELGGQYVVGIGGACHPINEWTAVEDYSQGDLQYLMTLAEEYASDPEAACGATAGAVMVSSLTLLLCLLTALI